jgi:adenylyltransferase/sulfurtransferase
LAAVATEFPRLGEVLLERGNIRSYITVFIDNRDIRDLDGPQTALGSDTVVKIIPSISGGTSAPETESLTQEEVLRYSRQVSLPQVTMKGQMKLRAARVLCIGVGGLGCPAAMYLAAAGIGTLGLVDDDLVDRTNLHRQILHHTPDLSKHKLDSAAPKLKAVNPHVELELHRCRLTFENAVEIISQYDVVLDGTDNYGTRYIVNEVCARLGKPIVYGSIFQFDGQVSVFNANGGPCYRCLFPEQPPAELIPNCADGGVLGVLPGIIGTIQAIEVLKLIIGMGEPLIGRLLVCDTMTMEFNVLGFSKKSNCLTCSEQARSAPLKLSDFAFTCGLETQPSPASQISARELRAQLHGDSPPVLIDVRDEHELLISSLESAIHIPLRELSERVAEIPHDREVVVFCKGGVRSVSALLLLKELGFPHVRNLTGGINEYASSVDPRINIY